VSEVAPFLAEISELPSLDEIMAWTAVKSGGSWYVSPPASFFDLAVYWANWLA
jgi:hypothetical protein